MSDEDLFGDSSDSGGDTDDLIAEARKIPDKPAAKKKTKRLQKKGSKDKTRKRKEIPDADNDSDEELVEEKPKKKKSSSSAPKKKLSKKERMEALARQRRHDGGGTSTAPTEKDGDKEDGGYSSAASYDSATFVRTQEDDDFIDAEGEDPEALKELYAEQHFDEEEAEEDNMEDDGKRRRKRKGGASSYRPRGPDALSDMEDGEGEPKNPILAAVHKMKRKKKEKKKLSELEEDAKAFLDQMEAAADEDDKALQEKRPATKKLVLLPTVLEILAKKDMMRPLLDYDLLTTCKRWIQPLPNGTLGNVTLRQKLIGAIANMTGENGVTAQDLKRSSFGKTVMTLCMHKSETPTMKRNLKGLIEQWSRPIFQKSGNMKDLDRVLANRRQAGIVGIARAQQQQHASPAVKSSKAFQEDISNIIASGKAMGNRDLGSNRVRVPYSKGFQFTVRPKDKIPTAQDAKRGRSQQMKDSRDGLHKKMLERNRPASKNQRSANISVEGRPCK